MSWVNGPSVTPKKRLMAELRKERLMRKWRLFQGLMCVVVVGFMSVCAACQSGPQPQQAGSGSTSESQFNHGPHHLGSVCKTGQVPDVIKINVDATDKVLTDPKSSVIFVCEGDQITWITTNTKIKITVTIEGDHAKELFKTGNTTAVWDPKHNTGAGPANQTPVETVEKPLNFVFLHKYSIVVDDPDANKHYTIDPHVIPMAKVGR
jgi:hypothetical protein